jgi:hypothetical protein
MAMEQWCRVRQKDGSLSWYDPMCGLLCTICGDLRMPQRPTPTECPQHPNGPPGDLANVTQRRASITIVPAYASKTLRDSSDNDIAVAGGEESGSSMLSSSDPAARSFRLPSSTAPPSSASLHAHFGNSGEEVGRSGDSEGSGGSGAAASGSARAAAAVQRSEHSAALLRALLPAASLRRMSVGPGGSRRLRGSRRVRG